MAEQERPLIQTHELDIPAFRAGLFDWGPRILAPIEWKPDYDTFVDLSTAIEQTNTLPNTFFPWCVTGGIGVYSLKKEPAGILAKWDIMFRHATPDEAEHDFDHFGEQVMGPEVGKGEDEKYKGYPQFRFLNEKFYYTGPPRLVKSRFATRVFSNGRDFPKKDALEGFVREVDSIGLPAEDQIAPQGYRLFYAVNGNIHHTGFGKLEDYKPEQMNPLWGSVELQGHKMTFYPQGDRDKPKDFSACLEDVPEEFL